MKMGWEGRGNWVDLWMGVVIKRRGKKGVVEWCPLARTVNLQYFQHSRGPQLTFAHILDPTQQSYSSLGQNPNIVFTLSNFLHEVLILTFSLNEEFIPTVNIIIFVAVFALDAEQQNNIWNMKIVRNSIKMIMSTLKGHNF